MSSSRLGSASVFSPVKIRCTVRPLELRAEHLPPLDLRPVSPMGSRGASYVPTVSSPNGEHCAVRSEEHTSELQSLRHLVCRLLLEKKKKKQIKNIDLIE